MWRLRLRLTQPQITRGRDDRGYAKDLVVWARDRVWLTLRIASCPKGTESFVVLPRPWKVERTIGWCMNARRNARDDELLPQHSESHLNRGAHHALPDDPASHPQKPPRRLNEEAHHRREMSC